MFVLCLRVFGAHLAKKNLRKKHNESIDLSLSLDRTFVTKSPAELKARSASTEVGGRVTIAEKSFSSAGGRSRLADISKSAISRFII